MFSKLIVHCVSLREAKTQRLPTELLRFYEAKHYSCIRSCPGIVRSTSKATITIRLRSFLGSRMLLEM